MYNGYLTEEGIGTLSPYHNPNSPNWKVLQKTTDPLLVVFGDQDIYKPSVKVGSQLWIENGRLSRYLTVKIVKGASHSYIGKEKELVNIIFDWIQKNFLR